MSKTFENWIQNSILIFSLFAKVDQKLCNWAENMPVLDGPLVTLPTELQCALVYSPIAKTALNDLLPILHLLKYRQIHISASAKKFSWDEVTEFFVIGKSK